MQLSMISRPYGAGMEHSRQQRAARRSRVGAKTSGGSRKEDARGRNRTRAIRRRTSRPEQHVQLLWTISYHVNPKSVRSSPERLTWDKALKGEISAFAIPIDFGRTARAALVRFPKRCRRKKRRSLKVRRLAMNHEAPFNIEIRWLCRSAPEHRVLTIPGARLPLAPPGTDCPARNPLHRFANPYGGAALLWYFWYS